MITEQAVKDMINLIEMVEAEIKAATDLFSRAKKYLRETPLTEFDVDLDITVTLLAVLLVITEPYKIVSFEFAVVK